MARRWLTPSTQPPSPANSGWDVSRSAVKVAIVGNVLVVLLFFVAVIWRLFFSGKSQQGAAARQGDGAATARADAPSSAESSPCASPRGKGLRKEDLMALPVYVHREEGGKVECAVCICELGDGHTGRLLPRCGHRFHAECVDRWFRSHATCPLCRALVADGG
ncbi:unnamed protein product [Alopecurus aequalis]